MRKKRKAEEPEVELVEPQAGRPKVPKRRKKCLLTDEINVAAQEFERGALAGEKVRAVGRYEEKTKGKRGRA